MDENMSVELMYDELKEQAVATFGEQDAKIIDKAFEMKEFFFQDLHREVASLGYKESYSTVVQSNEFGLSTSKMRIVISSQREGDCGKNV